MSIMDKTEVEREYFNLIKQGKAILADGYYIENDKLMFVEPISENCKWNRGNRVWIDNRTLEEQLEYLKQEILKNTRELLVYKESGFSNDELQAKIDILVEKHRAISEEIAREENKLY